MDKYQERIPPSRRTGSYRQIIERTAQYVEDREAVVSSPRTSLNDRASDGIETLADPDLPGAENHVASQVSRQSSRRSSHTAIHPAQPRIGNDGDAGGAASGNNAADEIADKSEEDLIRRFGKRKTRKLLAGSIGWENGRFYDMSLVRGCYEAHKWDFWLGAALFLVGCKSILPRCEADGETLRRWLYLYLLRPSSTISSQQEMLEQASDRRGTTSFWRSVCLQS